VNEGSYFSIFRQLVVAGCSRLALDDMHFDSEVAKAIECLWAGLKTKFHAPTQYDDLRPVGNQLLDVTGLYPGFVPGTCFHPNPKLDRPLATVSRP
jgi:hypothetical protein